MQLITAAEAAGDARVAEMNQQVAVNLDRIITALEADYRDVASRKRPPMPPDNQAPLAIATARRHELTRTKAIQALREPAAPIKALQAVDFDG